MGNNINFAYKMSLLLRSSRYTGIFPKNQKIELKFGATQYAGNYAIHCLLGDGGQANVYLGSKGSKMYALKVYLPGSSKEEAFKIEVEFLKKLNFPHLINMVDHQIDAEVKLNGKLPEKKPLLVLELAQGGELFEFISKQGRFTPQISRVLVKQLISAVKYLNEVGVTHRDIKPENILFDGEFNLRVSDFGLSRLTEGDQKDFKLYSRVGTEGYKPPEMEAGNYLGFQADIFAVGVVLFVMYTGSPPFLSTKAHDKIYKIIKQKNFAKFWTMHEKNKPAGFYPDSFKRLLNSFFSAEVDRRPTAETLADDEWLKSDEPMHNEVFQYLKAKYDKIAENDATKQKIEAVRKELLLKEVMDEECCEPGERGSTEFLKDYHQFEVKTETLEELEIKGLSYSSHNPSFVLAWLMDGLKSSLAENNIFIQDFFLEVKPLEYNLTYDEKTQSVSVNLSFQIENQDIEELLLKGRLIRDFKGGVSVDWAKVSGNEFWLTAAIAYLNGRLQSIA